MNRNQYVGVAGTILILTAACEPSWDTEITGRIEYVMPVGPRIVHNEGRTALFMDEDIKFVNMEVNDQSVTWDFDAVYVVRGNKTTPKAGPDGTFLVAENTSGWIDVTYVEQLGDEQSAILRDQIQPPEIESTPSATVAAPPPE